MPKRPSPGRKALVNVSALSQWRSHARPWVRQVWSGAQRHKGAQLGDNRFVHGGPARVNRVKSSFWQRVSDPHSVTFTLLHTKKTVFSCIGLHARLPKTPINRGFSQFRNGFEFPPSPPFDVDRPRLTPQRPVFPTALLSPHKAKREASTGRGGDACAPDLPARGFTRLRIGFREEMRHPPKGTLCHPAARQTLESTLPSRAAHHFHTPLRPAAPNPLRHLHAAVYSENPQPGGPVTRNKSWSTPRAPGYPPGSRRLPRPGPASPPAHDDA